ncbi:MAG: prepilin-type N-terminal cleavage/methylation domain-containing protein [Patescibacteria group bacterium]|nr:prepilin-type N-terminal cleavage/methylation domain-containing protein [Patescibacteria group bacterium]
MKKKGFTLIELLIVIAIIAILAAIIYVAVDPVRRLSEARNAERWSSVNSILNAVLKYTVDNQGVLPSNLSAATAGNYYVLGTAGSGCNTTCTAQATQAACLDLSNNLVSTYLASMPIDSKTGSAANTDYYIMKSSTGRIMVGACDAESVGGTTPTISVSR